ncbi:MAG: DTW domain-containing protein [Verrucomicrobia bacterium]|nr:DTW domain-containing protein [Verrucomicrobiota bacterium]
MVLFPPTLILRHRRENLKKCSLRGLEGRKDCHFFTYPKQPLPPLEGYFALSLDAPLLTEADAHLGILLIDGTWRHAQVMERQIPDFEKVPKRSLPAHFQTAYPRRQEDCKDPSRGLASVEALYLSYRILGRGTEGLLDHYHWKEAFLTNCV